MKRCAAILALAFLAGGCKSKLEKCNDACARIDRDEKAKCASDPDPATCHQLVSDTTASCLDLCAVAMGGKRPPRDVGDDLQKECDAGKMKSCEDLGGMYLLGRGGFAKSDERAYALFQKACDGGLAFDCESAGRMVRDGRGTFRDPARAHELLQKGCDGNAMGACTSLGLEAITVRGGDRRSGVALLTRACDGNDKLACTGLGGMYLHGTVVRRDRRRARTLLEKACRLGETQACIKVATLR